MGFVQEALLEPGQTVEGVVIAQEDDLKIRRALSMARNIRLMKYRVEFHLEPVGGSGGAGGGWGEGRGLRRRSRRRLRSPH